MKDIYQAITDRITAQLEQGVIPWHKPWIVSGKACAISRSTGKPYSLLNQLILGKPGEYATFAQIKQEGGMVKRGAKAQFIVFWKWIEQEDKDNLGEIKKIPFLRYFNVFHLDDCDGLQPKHKTAAAQRIQLSLCFSGAVKTAKDTAGNAPANSNLATPTITGHQF